jgi:altronate hydrolase
MKKKHLPMKNVILKIHPADNVLVALADLKKGDALRLNGQSWTLADDIPAKHKFAAHALAPGDEVRIYGVLVGKAQRDIPAGGLLSTENLKHAASGYTLHDGTKTTWQAPDVSKWKNRTFLGYRRPDGSVGTANYWLVIPLVFCENRNTDVLREALVHDLGYDKKRTYRTQTQQLIQLYQAGKSVAEILEADLQTQATSSAPRLFPNVDGVKFLTHEGGCGGTRQDAQALCGLLAGYVTHPNVAGATVLSLGCQHAQVQMLLEEISRRDAHFQKPIFVLEQQKIGAETDLIGEALKKTFAGLVETNRLERQPAPLSKLCIGLECGGSDGFSGISANPVLGHLSDLLVALGGSVILSEFPELCGVEQELCDRCADPAAARRFSELMTTYNARAQAVGSGFDMNPSPGNIRDGLITDAIKSAGAAKKGGTSPVVAVLDYPEKVEKNGLHLLCTPGNDVESTTAEVASGATVVLFTTGLGTPTGNPIAPVVKISSNTALARKMPDIIDFDAGGVISGEESIEQAAERLLEYVISVASGQAEVAAVRLEQDDFIPWKRGVSL